MINYSEKTNTKKTLTLGSIYKQQVKIKFVNENKQVLRTIARVWAITSKYVILREGRLIPMTNIITADLC